MVPGPSRSQIRWSACGSSQVANPLDSAVQPMPAWVAWRLAHSWPLTHSLNLRGVDRRTRHEVVEEVASALPGCAADQELDGRFAAAQALGVRA
jgi:hypothetical protein